MAQNEINQYNESDETNTDITGTTVVQNAMYPYMVDDAFRKLMGALKRTFRSDLFRLRDSTDQTKLLALDISAGPTATTRTWTAPLYGGTVSLQGKGANIASAATTNIWAATGDFIHITGTTTITSFGATSTAGWERTVIFDGALTLTHNATSLILPGAANILTAAGDRAIVRSEGGGNAIVVAYLPASGAALSTPVGSVVQTAAASYTANTDITSTTLPLDDTIPQSGEGIQIISTAITPLSSTNRIRMTFTGQCTLSTTGSIAVSLFRTGDANAVGASYVGIPSANIAAQLVVTAEFVAGTTSSITLVARAGVTSGTARFNGSTAARLFGGASQAVLRIEEIKA